jgi:hypothetical protein
MPYFHPSSFILALLFLWTAARAEAIVPASHSLQKGIAMTRFVWLLSPLVLAGCFFDEQSVVPVPSNPFGQAPIVQGGRVITASAPASFAEAKRVDTVGYGILVANPQLNFRPLFMTVGAPDPEIFHRGTASVVITEGLAKQCQTNAQLAAVLCLELGKMAAEHEALVGPGAKVPERSPPMEVRVGSDNGGGFGPADQVYRAELAKYEQEYKQKTSLPQGGTPPDAQTLARGYLSKAGYAAGEVDAVAPMLRAAAENNTFAERVWGPPTAATQQQ